MGYKKRKILLINLFDNINTSIGSRHYNIIKYLHFNNYSVTLISNNPEFNNHFVDAFLLIKKRPILIKLYRVLNKIIKTIGIFNYSDPQMFYLRNYKIKLSKILGKENFSSVVILALPFSLYKLGKFIKNRSNASLILDQSDPLFCNNNTLNFKSDSSKINNLIQFEKTKLFYFDKFIVLSKRIKSKYIQAIPELEKKIYVIEQGFDQINNKTTSFTQNDKTKNHTLIYAGKFYKGIREPYNFFEALSFMDNIHLKLFGQISKEFLPKNQINYSYYDSISFNKLVNEYKKSDIIVFIDNFKGIQIPGKLFETISIGKPVLYIYDEHPNILDFNLNLNHVFITKNETNKIKETILRIINNYNSLIVNRNELNNYTWKSLMSKYIKIIENK